MCCTLLKCVIGLIRPRWGTGGYVGSIANKARSELKQSCSPNTVVVESWCLERVMVRFIIQVSRLIAL